MYVRRVKDARSHDRRAHACLLTVNDKPGPQVEGPQDPIGNAFTVLLRVGEYCTPKFMDENANRTPPNTSATFCLSCCSPSSTMKLALALLALLPGVSAQITSAKASVFNTGTACADIVAACTFTGDCCSVTNSDTGGCTLTILGGTCSPSGVGCPWSLTATSTSTDACPAGDYDVLSGAPAPPPVDSGDGGTDETAAAGYRQNSMLLVASAATVAALLI